VSFDSSNLNHFIIYINYGVQDYHGRFIGVIGISISLDEIRERINILQKQYDRQISFINREGVIALSSDDSLRGKSIHSMPALIK